MWLTVANIILRYRELAYMYQSVMNGYYGYDSIFIAGFGVYYFAE